MATDILADITVSDGQSDYWRITNIYIICHYKVTNN